MNQIAALRVAVLAMASGLSACSAPVDADPTLPLAQLDEMQRALGGPQPDTYLIGTASVPGVARAEPLTGSWQMRIGLLAMRKQAISDVRQN